jgi:hypothetical protein
LNYNLSGDVLVSWLGGSCRRRQGHAPSISTSSEKLRAATLSLVGVDDDGSDDVGDDQDLEAEQMHQPRFRRSAS